MKNLPNKAYAFVITILFFILSIFTFSIKAQSNFGAPIDQKLFVPLPILNANDSVLTYKRDSIAYSAFKELSIPLQLLSANDLIYSYEKDSVTFLALKIHLIKNDDGSSILELEDIIYEIEEVNNFFKSSHLQFYLYDSVNYINDTDLNSFEIAENEVTLRSRAESNVINVYLVETINATTTPFAAYTYLPPGPDIIFMTHSSVVDNQTTLAHELGHYLGLYHTHGPFNRKLTNELVDGSNCNIAGDLICDTPADPNLLGKIDDNCAYTGNLTDRNGDLFKPDVNNIMSYSLDKCSKHFTEGQFTWMLSTLKTFRSYLKRYKEPVYIGERIEIEEFFQVEVEKGNKSNIKVFEDFISDSDEGIAVTLFDKGDQLKVIFTIEESGDYQLGVRIRSGFPGNPTRYWQQGYSFAINNEPIFFEGDTASISPLYNSFGGAHWSKMNKFMELEKGDYSFSIASQLNWGAIDYIEILKVEEEEEEVLIFQRIEVEDEYKIISDEGNKAKIGVFDKALDYNDSSKVITLFDIGDKFSIDFEIEKRSRYEIGVSLRSGHQGNNSRYWPKGYSFEINGQPVIFEGDTSTISPFNQALGGAYWGVMKFEAILDIDTCSLSIQSNLHWAAVDYVYIREIPNNIPTDVLLSNQKLDENNEIGDFIGILTTVDEDLEDVHTYKLVDDELDNLNFRVIEDSLFSNQVFDYEKRTEYSIKIETFDQFGGSLEKVISIQIGNVYDSYVSFVLSELNQVYDGAKKSVSVETNPKEVSFQLTYNGKREVPIEAGTYLVNVESADSEYQGSSMDTLVIEKATAQIMISDLEQIYDGTSKTIEVSTEPTNLDVFVTYNNQDSLPISVGDYNVKVAVIDKNFKGEIETDLWIYQLEDSVGSANSSSRLTDLKLENLETDNVAVGNIIGIKKVFPNPTTGRLTILANTIDENIQIRIYDSSGRLLSSFNKFTKSKELRIDLAEQPKGIYFIQLMQKEKVEVFKIIKQ